MSNNIFNYLSSSFLKKKSTYGDLMSNDSQEKKINNILNNKEYKEFNEYKAMNKERLYNNCGNNDQSSTYFIQSFDKPKRIISGIGEVQQMM